MEGMLVNVLALLMGLFMVFVFMRIADDIRVIRKILHRLLELSESDVKEIVVQPRKH